jgi:hypothetical protein
MPPDLRRGQAALPNPELFILTHHYQSLQSSLITYHSSLITHHSALITQLLNEGQTGMSVLLFLFIELAQRVEDQICIAGCLDANGKDFRGLLKLKTAARDLNNSPEACLSLFAA